MNDAKADLADILFDLKDKAPTPKGFLLSISEDLQNLSGENEILLLHTLTQLLTPKETLVLKLIVYEVDFSEAAKILKVNVQELEDKKQKLLLKLKDPEVLKEILKNFLD